MINSGKHQPPVRVYHCSGKKILSVRQYSEIFEIFRNIRNGEETFFCTSYMLVGNSYYPLAICCSFPNQVE